jgi:hypothetical protein
VRENNVERKDGRNPNEQINKEIFSVFFHINFTKRTINGRFPEGQLKKQKSHS